MIGAVPSAASIEVVDMPHKRLPIDLYDLRRRYEAGQSVLAMATDLETSRPTIMRRLRELGLDPRSGSEANYIRMARLTQAERRDLAAAANASRRKPEVNFGSRQANRMVAAINSAKSRTRTVGKGEAEMLDLLLGRGLTVECQLPVYGYNLDLAVAPVAVEVWWAKSYPFRHGRTARRTIDLADLGWSTIFVWLCWQLPTDDSADAVVAFIDEMRRNPPAVRQQYRVIRSDGDFVSGGAADLDNLALVPPSHHSPG